MTSLETPAILILIRPFQHFVLWEMANINVDKESFKKRIKRIYSAWKVNMFGVVFFSLEYAKPLNEMLDRELA